VNQTQVIPLVSVVLPTYNRLEQLKQVLAGLESQTLPPDQFEVLVISDGSTDGTVEYLRQFQTPLNINVHTQPNQGVAAARNTGIAQARGEILLFIDDDVVPTSGLIQEHLRVHQHQGSNIVVIGPMLTPPDYVMSPWVRWEQERLVRQYQDMTSGKWEPTARQFYTGNTSLARCHFDTMPGFDNSFRRAEDVELGYRLAARGIKFIFYPNAVGYHYAERSFKSWVAIPAAYGKNDVIFALDKGQGWLLPVIFREYHTRHPLIRVMNSVCLGRPAFVTLALELLSISLRLGTLFKLAKLEDLACSGLFNLLYYQGVVDQLGGRNNFFSQLDKENWSSQLV
jgi:GT2 family glycosyltransferase